MNVPLRLTTALFLVLVMVAFVPCAPALAQTSPAEAQYVGESAEDFADNAGPGTDAVNDAMSGTASSASPSASDGASASPAGVPSSSDADGGSQTGDDTDTEGGSGSITRLPETGGAPLAALGSGILLAVFSLIAYRSAGR